jgi:hypothetical protein
MLTQGAKWGGKVHPIAEPELMAIIPPDSRPLAAPAARAISRTHII